MGWQLVVKESGRRVSLVRGENPLGSGSKSAVRIEHPTVSRAHARLTVRDGSVTIEDLGSSNGTRVDGRLIAAPVDASDTTRLEFGLVVCELVPISAGDAQAAVALPERDPAATAPSPSRRHATLVAEGSSRFAIEDFPELLEFARRRRSIVDVSAQAYATLSRTFSGLAFSIETERGQLLAGRPVHADARITDCSAGRFVVRAYGARADRVNAGPAIRLCAGLLDLIDSAPGPETTVEAAPDRERSRPVRPSPLTVEPAMIEIYDRAERVAPSRLSVLIQGETGTGKELLARFVHASSAREGEFVAINCAALSRELLEAELFGIEAGVATGVQAREGRFIQADGGTLLLDEVTEMPDDCQAKLLRVLQEGEVVAVGARRPRRIDVRVIAATNRLVSARSDDSGPLRADLVHRLSGWSVALPPLRERIADLPQLAAHFFARGAEQSGRTPAGVSRSAMEALCAYDWPGNVRELEQEMQRAALFVDDGQLLTRDQLSPQIGSTVAEATDLKDVSDDAQRKAVERALASAGGNATRAARALGISRATLYRRIRELGIRR
jgi:DNA-binding NtrC family response regulator